LFRVVRIENWQPTLDLPPECLTWSATGFSTNANAGQTLRTSTVRVASNSASPGD